MFDLRKNYQQVQERIARAALANRRKPQDITLVAVSKYAPMERVQRLIELGHRDLGESRVQDAREKIQAFDKEVRWHLIGRLQTNKIKYLSPFHLIHSLDRWSLAEKLGEHAQKKDMSFNCLLQINIAQDPNKAGVLLKEVDDFIEASSDISGLNIKGLMTITALDANEKETKEWFDLMAQKYQSLSSQGLPSNVTMEWLSMGMSNDFELAIASGANLVRVGSAIFA